MSTRKQGANRSDQNFIRRCIVEDADWSIERVANHLQMDVKVCKRWFETISKELEDGPETIPDKAEDGPDAVEEFDEAP